MIAYHRLRRKLKLRPRVLSRLKRIPYSTDRMDHFAGEVFVHLGPQPAHEDVHDIGLRIKAVIPDVFEDHGFRHHSASVAHQVFEERKFTGLELDGLAVTRDLAS